MRHFLCDGISLPRILLSLIRVSYDVNLIAILLRFRSTVAFQLAIARNVDAGTCVQHEIYKFQRMFYTSCIDAAKSQHRTAKWDYFYILIADSILPVFREPTRITVVHKYGNFPYYLYESRSVTRKSNIATGVLCAIAYVAWCFRRRKMTRAETVVTCIM